jgi:hypothetical protein
MLGMFLGGIPEAAASASMLTKAGNRPAAIFGLWSSVLLAGVIAAAAGKAFIGVSDALVAFAQALAGGAVPIHLSKGSIMMRRPMVILETAPACGQLAYCHCGGALFERFLRSGSNGCQKADRSSRLRPEPALRRARTAPENGCFPGQLIHHTVTA